MCSNRRDKTDTEVTTDEPVSCQMGEKVGDDVIKETDEQTWNMAIVCSDTVVLTFPWDFYERLQKAIIDAVIAFEDVPIPSIDDIDFDYKKNYIRVTCVNEYSKRWLIDAVNNLSPFEETSLVAVDEKDVQEFRLFFVYAPKMYGRTGHDILKLIKRTAPAVKIEFWKARKPVTHSEDRYYASEFEITDPSSIRLIEEMEYEIRIGIGKAYFWDVDNYKGHEEAKGRRY